MLDVVSEHHFMEDLSTVHADEGVVHLGLSKGLEGLHIVALGGAVEGRAGNGSCG